MLRKWRVVVCNTGTVCTIHHEPPLSLSLSLSLSPSLSLVGAWLCKTCHQGHTPSLSLSNTHPLSLSKEGVCERGDLSGGTAAP